MVSYEAVCPSTIFPTPTVCREPFRDFFAILGAGCWVLRAMSGDWRELQYVPDTVPVCNASHRNTEQCNLIILSNSTMMKKITCKLLLECAVGLLLSF